MGVLIYGVQFACDVCGARGDRPAVPADPPPIFSNLAVPDGWANLALMKLTFNDVYGAPITHLCKDCAALTMRGLVERLQANYERQRQENDSGR